MERRDSGPHEGRSFPGVPRRDRSFREAGRNGLGCLAHLPGVMHRRICILSALILAFLAACGRDEAVEPAPPGSPAAVMPEKAVVHWRSFGTWDEATIEAAARAEMIIFPMEHCFSPESEGVLGELHRLNPDIRIVGYRSMMSVLTLYPDTVYLRRVLPYVLDYYYAVRDDWAWTTTQDTVLIWRDIVMLDPIVNGGLNTGLIDRMVDLIAEYQDRTGGAVDGIMHDYFMYDAYLNPTVRESMTGDVDFDDDGVRHEDDPDERALFYEWQKEYARAIRARLGDDFIQIGNGRPPQEDAGLAGLMNGIFYELYPNNPWYGTDRAGLLRLLENHRPGYLRPALGRTWSVCTNEKGTVSANNLFCLLSSLLAGCMYTELQGTYVFLGWTLDVTPGAPLGETAVEGAMDSILTVRRPFRNGEVRISFLPSGRREDAVFQAAE
jgi:hypothetical protein